MIGLLCHRSVDGLDWRRHTLKSVEEVEIRCLHVMISRQTHPPMLLSLYPVGQNDNLSAAALP